MTLLGNSRLRVHEGEICCGHASGLTWFRRLTAVAGCAALGLISACQSGDNSQGVRTDYSSPSSMVSAVDSLPQSALADASQFPIGNEWRERLDLTLLKQVWSLSYQQTQALIQQCMASKGFSYEPVEFVYNTDLLYRALNPLNDDIALKYGYHPPPIPGAMDANDYSQPGFLVALDGSESSQESGCAQSAYVTVNALSQAATDDAAAVLRRLSEATSGFDASGEGRAAWDAWAECMRSRGYPVATRSELSLAFAVAPDISGEELQARHADLECDRLVGLTMTQSSWEQTRFAAFLVEASGTWSEVQAELEDALQALVAL